MFVFILPIMLFRVGVFDLSEKNLWFNCSKEFWELYEKS